MSHTKVTVSAVTDLFETTLSDVQVNAWIDIAHRKVDRVLGDESSYDADDLQDIEKLYAAGLAQAADPRASRVSQGDTSETLETVDYLELAFGADETGKLRQAHEARMALDWTVGTYAD